MPKNIVICSDGTGNSAIKNRGTNVFKLYEAVDIHGYRAPGSNVPQQIAYYDDGVGTQSFMPMKILGMMFGLGLSKNVRDLYTDLARVYEKNDRIYMFGFSRGAFTVRTLAGFILCCGIPVAQKYPTDAELRKAVAKAYNEYRKRYRTFWSKGASDRPEIKKEENFAEVSSPWGPRYAGVALEFLGVWDTVDAVGMPFEELADLWDLLIYPFRFPDRKLSPRVHRACHAVSIDDQRKTFHPTMWDEKDAKAGQIDQTWFAGVHSNVGGGYPKQGLSLVALDWMMAQAEASGLYFLKSDRDSYRDHRDPHDKLYDSRAGVAVYYRWKPRDIAEICKKHHTVPRIHRSVFERIAQDSAGYAPGNLPANLEVAGTPPSQQPGRFHEIRDLVRGRITNRTHTSLLNLPNIKTWIRVGKLSYLAFLLLTLAALIIGLGPSVPALAGQPFFEKAATLIHWASETFSSLSTLWIILRRTWPWLIPGIAGIYFLSVCVDKAMERCFSSFWHKLSMELRDLMQ
jgi:uncharacterized protein (DUF2235 family)